MPVAAPDREAAPAEAKVANVKVPPILIYALFLAAAFAVDRLLPLRVPVGAAVRTAGYALIVAGCALIVWSILTFVLARVIPLPFTPPARLITAGPLRLSRNPIYLGGMVAYVGTAFVGGWIWVLVTALPLGLVVQRFVIAREERYLAQEFGDEYRAYAARVRRWI